MLKSIEKRRRQSARIERAKARAYRGPKSFDANDAAKRAGVEMPKHIDRVFNDQDAAGTRVHGSDAHDWEFVGDAAHRSVELRKAKPLKSSYANKHFKPMTREIGPSFYDG